MQKLHFSITINAPKEKVWHTMVDDKPYREWTAAFNPGSYYKGDWSKGSKILFLGPDPKTGEEGGMVSRIAENKPYEFISIEHLGIVKNGVEDTTSEEARKWAPAFENYTFKEKGGATEVLVEIDIEDENKKMFEEMWPKALQKLKENEKLGFESLGEREGEKKPHMQTETNMEIDTNIEFSKITNEHLVDRLDPKGGKPAAEEELNFKEALNNITYRCHNLTGHASQNTIRRILDMFCCTEGNYEKVKKNGQFVIRKRIGK